MTRLLCDADSLKLLFDEDCEEVVFGCNGSIKHLFEGLLVLLARHECWRDPVHEDFGKLPISLFNYVRENLIVLREVRLEKVKLVRPLEEALYLILCFHERIPGIFVNQILPYLLFHGRVRHIVIANTLHCFASIRVITLKCFLQEFFLLFRGEMLRCVVLLDDGVLVLIGEVTWKFLALDDDLTGEEPA